MSTSTDNSHPVGVVILVRHGDRMGFYQNPETYTPTDTQITPLGNVCHPFIFHRLGAHSDVLVSNKSTS